MGTRATFCALTATVMAATCLPAHASPIPIANAGFELTTDGPDGGVCYPGAGNTSCTNLTGWTNTDGYTFVSQTAHLGPSAYYAPYDVSLYFASTSPVGGNFIAADGLNWGAPRGSLSQTLNGLTIGTDYAVSFWQAAGQQSGFSGATTEQWQVSLGGSTLLSTLMNTPSQGSVGWNLQTLVFRATSVSEVLSFYALGTPNGQPPFVLLDGLSMVDVPEPSALAALAVGVAGLLVQRRRARK